MERAVGVVGRALITQVPAGLADGVLSDSCRKAGLADSRFARDQHDLPFALPGEALAFEQEIDLVLATDEIGQTRGADCLEAALGRRHTLDRPRRDRLRKTLKFVRAEIAQPEQIAEQPARRGSDDDRPGLSQRLEAGCQVWRIAAHGGLAQRTLAAEVADHHQARRDADANGEWLRGARLEPRNSGDHIERRPHGSLGIIFVRERIAEIGQYPVAPELGEEAVIGSRYTSASGVIGVDDGAHVLWIESPRQ